MLCFFRVYLRNPSGFILASGISNQKLFISLLKSVCFLLSILISNQFLMFIFTLSVQFLNFPHHQLKIFCVLYRLSMLLCLFRVLLVIYSIILYSAQLFLFTFCSLSTKFDCLSVQFLFSFIFNWICVNHKLWVFYSSTNPPTPIWIYLSVFYSITNPPTTIWIYLWGF